MSKRIKHITEFVDDLHEKRYGVSLPKPTEKSKSLAKRRIQHSIDKRFKDYEL